MKRLFKTLQYFTCTSFCDESYQLFSIASCAPFSTFIRSSKKQANNNNSTQQQTNKQANKDGDLFEIQRCATLSLRLSMRNSPRELQRKPDQGKQARLFA